MAFDVSAVTAYVQNNSKALATKAVGSAKTAKLLIDNQAVQTGVKGTAAILKLDTDVNFQDASACGRTALGTTTLSDKTITVKPIVDYQNVCTKTLYSTYFANMLAKGQSPESETIDSDFAQAIMDLKAAKVAEAVEILLWQGDTASGNANLNKINGILKQVTGASDEIVITETGADIVAKLQNAYGAMPVKIRKNADFRIFIGEDVFDSYAIALANKNIFKPVEDMTLFGTSAKLEVTPGLTGTSKVILARISDLQLGLDGTDDVDNVEFRYSMETKNWYLDFNFAVGVSAVYTAQIGYLVLS